MEVKKYFFFSKKVALLVQCINDMDNTGHVINSLCYFVGLDALIKGAYLKYVFQK